MFTTVNLPGRLHRRNPDLAYRLRVHDVVFAPLSTLGERITALGANKLLVLASSDRHLAPLRAALARFELTVIDRARVHVPAETVDAAATVLASAGADTLIAIGGGSPIGLGKALRLSHDVRFVAVPTTYAGSERTQMYGITRAGDKQTGRDERVRPDLVLYDLALTQDMPLTISVQSLCNALAHVISVLSTDSLAEPARSQALVAARETVRAIEELIGAPRDRPARGAAQRAASECAALYDQGKAGVQHALAHLLGGAFDLEHAALHALLLPQFLAHLQRTRPALVDELQQAIGEPELRVHERPTIRDLAEAVQEARTVAALPALGARLHGLLVAAHAPVTLTRLGVKREALERLLASRPELPAQIALDAI
ncbi:maleylacetate reductase [soil metagenome]